jgi:hypothetical protein
MAIKADAILIDAKFYEKHLKASNLFRLLQPAEEDIVMKRSKPARSVFQSLKRARKISG